MSSDVGAHRFFCAPGSAHGSRRHLHALIERRGLTYRIDSGLVLSRVVIARLIDLDDRVDMGPYAIREGGGGIQSICTQADRDRYAGAAEAGNQQVFTTDDPAAFIAFLRSMEGVQVEETATRFRVSRD
jgi:hypothetical protein